MRLRARRSEPAAVPSLPVACAGLPPLSLVAPPRWRAPWLEIREDAKVPKATVTSKRSASWPNQRARAGRNNSAERSSPKTHKLWRQNPTVFAVNHNCSEFLLLTLVMGWRFDFQLKLHNTQPVLPQQNREPSHKGGIGRDQGNKYPLGPPRIY